MRKGFKSMAMLLCACMMLEMACGTAFAKQPEVTSEAAPAVEEAAPEVTVEPEASTDAAETEAAEEQKAPAEETETGAEAEDGSTEPENDTEQEAAPEEEKDPEKEDVSETEGVTEKEDAQETETARETEDAQKNEDASGAETEDASESEEASESEDALEADAAGTLGTEGIEDPEGDRDEETVAPVVDDALEAGNASKQESIPEEEKAESAETVEDPEGAEEAEGLAENETAEISQAGIEPISDDNSDYYVLLSGTDTLIFQSTLPQGEEWIKDNNYWGQKSDDSFGLGSLTPGWRNDTRKSNIHSVVFKEEITLSGNSLLAGFSALQNVRIDNKVTLKNTAGQMMFADCSALTTINGIDKLETAEVTKMWSMFGNCGSLTSLDLSSFDTSKVENMQSMFNNCTNLETLTGLSGWDTSKVENMQNIFFNCSSLTELDLSNWNTEKVTNEKNYFSGCSSLRKLTVGKNFHMPSDDAGAEKIHDSNDTGVWVSETDKTGPRWTDELFIKLFERGHAAGTYIWGYTLTYNANSHDGAAPRDMTVYGDGESVTLLGQGDIEPRDQEVFIGWSEDVKGLVQTAEDAAGVLKEGDHLEFGNANKTVYAVFAEDKNRDGTPDYDETFVDITFDINGGDGSKDTNPNHKDTFPETGKVSGTPLTMYVYGTLKWTKTWNKDGSPASHPAILAGWSLEPISDIILEDDKDEDGKKLSDQLENRTSITVPDKNTTYYAVYAADEDNNEEPDYLEDSLQVEYYANGGRRVNGADWLYGIDELFYRCSHHHVPNEDGVVLLDLDHGKEYVERDGAVLLGWSENKVTKLVADENEKKSANIVTEVKMPSAGNKKVYAVWAEDRNKNSIPDYNETKLKVTFNIGKGHGDGKDPVHDKTFTVEVLPGTEVDLPHYSELHWSEEWEKDGQPADHAAVLAGWADHPVNGVILEDDTNDEAQTHEHLSDQMIKKTQVKITRDITFYAMYAADENDDQEPDYLEGANQVLYYANGGTMISGTWLDGKEGLFYKCGHHHVAGETVTLLRVERGMELIKRDKAVLLGWSKEPIDGLLVKGKEDGRIITEIQIASGSDANKVYAVWGEEDDSGSKPGDTPEDPGNKPDNSNGENKPAPSEPNPSEPAPEPPARPEGPDRYLSSLVYPEGGSSSDTSDNTSEQSTVEGWLQDAVGWRYRYADGSVAAGRWEWIKNKWYYFNADGYMATGWKQLSGVWYYLDEVNGDMKTGWQLIKGVWYYLDEVNGDMKTGWQLIKGVWYHLDDVSGAMDTGWYLDPSSWKWYYLDSSGAMQIGWQLVSGTYYYLNESAKDGKPYGSMYANETTPDGYAVDASGAWIQ